VCIALLFNIAEPVELVGIAKLFLLISNFFVRGANKYTRQKKRIQYVHALLVLHAKDMNFAILDTSIDLCPGCNPLDEVSTLFTRLERPKM